MSSPALSRMNSLEQGGRVYPCDQQPPRDLSRVNSIDQSRVLPPPGDAAARLPGPYRLSRVNSSDNTRVNYMDQTVANLMEQQQQQGGGANGRDSLRSINPASQSEGRPPAGGSSGGGPVTAAVMQQRQPESAFQRQNSINKATNTTAAALSGLQRQNAVSQGAPYRSPGDGQLAAGTQDGPHTAVAVTTAGLPVSVAKTKATMSDGGGGGGNGPAAGGGQPVNGGHSVGVVPPARASAAKQSSAVPNDSNGGQPTVLTTRQMVLLILRWTILRLSFEVGF